MAVGPDFMAYTKGAEAAIAANQRDEDRWIKMQDDEVKRQNAIIDRQYAERDQAFREQQQSLELEGFEDKRASRAAARIGVNVQTMLASAVKGGRSLVDAVNDLSNTTFSPDPLTNDLVRRNIRNYVNTDIIPSEIKAGRGENLRSLAKNWAVSTGGLEDTLGAMQSPEGMNTFLTGRGFTQNPDGTYRTGFGDVSDRVAYRVANGEGLAAVLQDEQRIKNEQASAAKIEMMNKNAATNSSAAVADVLQTYANSTMDLKQVPAHLRSQVEAIRAEQAAYAARSAPATGASTLSPLDQATRQPSGMRIPLPAGITPSMGRGNTGNPGFVSAITTPAMPSQPQFVAPAQQYSNKADPFENTTVMSIAKINAQSVLEKAKRDRILAERFRQ